MTQHQHYVLLQLSPHGEMLADRPTSHQSVATSLHFASIRPTCNSISNSKFIKETQQTCAKKNTKYQQVTS